MDATEDEIARMQEERRAKEQELAALASVSFDKDLYGGGDKDRFAGYEMSIPVMEDEEEQDATEREVARKLASYTAPKELLHEVRKLASYTAPKELLHELPRGEAEEEVAWLKEPSHIMLPGGPAGFKKPSRIIDREDDYRRRRLNRIISPDRHDAFAMVCMYGPFSAIQPGRNGAYEADGDATPDAAVRTYADVIKEEALKREKEETLRQIAKRRRRRLRGMAAELSSAPHQGPRRRCRPRCRCCRPCCCSSSAAAAAAAGSKRRNRWDVAGGGGLVLSEVEPSECGGVDEGDEGSPRQQLIGMLQMPLRRCLGERPSLLVAGTPLPWGVAVRSTPPPRAIVGTLHPWSGSAVDATPTPGPRRNRWDETPSHGGVMPDDATPSALPGGGGATPGLGGGATPAGMAWDATPKLSAGATPTPKKTRSRWDETPAGGGVTPAGGGGGATRPLL
ncbi:unnamed protein product [Closterium sp. NIES-64]|nr:unnamed protein product [Closterium sp. NIES-64]